MLCIWAGKGVRLSITWSLSGRSYTSIFRGSISEQPLNKQRPCEGTSTKAEIRYDPFRLSSRFLVMCLLFLSCAVNRLLSVFSLFNHVKVQIIVMWRPSRRILYYSYMHLHNNTHMFQTFNITLLSGRQQVSERLPQCLIKDLGTEVW